jgi:putative transcriptional regulator
LRGVPTENHKDRVYFGGPVMRQSVVAVFRSDAPPNAAAFPLLKGIFLTLHPDNVRMLLADPSTKMCLYAGFSGWGPRQLQSEFQRQGWLVAAPTEAVLFRASTEGLWEEMVQPAQGRTPKAGFFPIDSVADFATMPRP